MGAGIVASASAGTLTQGVSDVMGVVGTVMDTIVANPILLAYFAAGVIPVCAGVLHSLKHS